MTSTDFSITTDIQYETEVVTSDSVEEYLNAMNVPMSLWVAGCNAEAVEYMLANRKLQTVEDDLLIRGERAQEEGSIEYSEMETWAENGKSHHVEPCYLFYKKC